MRRKTIYQLLEQYNRILDKTHAVVISAGENITEQILNKAIWRTIRAEAALRKITNYWKD